MNAGSFTPFLLILTVISHHAQDTMNISLDLHTHTRVCVCELQKEYKLATVVVQELLEVDGLKCIIKFHIS